MILKTQSVREKAKTPENVMSDHVRSGQNGELGLHALLHVGTDNSLESGVARGFIMYAIFANETCFQLLSKQNITLYRICRASNQKIMLLFYRNSELKKTPLRPQTTNENAGMAGEMKKGLATTEIACKVGEKDISIINIAFIYYKRIMILQFGSEKFLHNQC